MKLRFFLLIIPAIHAVTQAQIQCEAKAGTAPMVRAEGLAELVGDLTLECSGGTPTTAGTPVPTSTIRVFLNTNITSRLLTATDGWSEALLLADEPHSTANPSVPLRLCGDTLTNEVPGVPGTCQIYGTGDGLGVYSGTSGFTPISGNYDARNRPNVFQGRQTAANSMEWQNVPIDPAVSPRKRIFRIVNVRANANQLGVSNTLTPTSISMFVSITGATSVTVTNQTQTVASSLPGLAPSQVRGSGFFVQSFSQNGDLAVGNRNAPNPNAYTGSGSSLGNQGFQFVARATENFPGSFKKLNFAQTDLQSVTYPEVFWNQNVPGERPSTEDGFVNTNLAFSRAYVEPSRTIGATTAFPDVRGMRSAGVANHGTRLVFQFTGVPAGVQLWVPGATTVNSTLTGIRTGTTRLIQTDADGAGGFAPVPVNASGYAQLGIFNGNATAVFEVLFSDPLAVERVDLPIAVAYAANPANNLPTPDVQSKISIGIAPTGAVTASSFLAPTPRFAPTGGEQLNTFIITRNTQVGQLTVAPNFMFTTAKAQQLSVEVTSTSNQQSWTAVSNASWLTINNGSSAGFGDGTVRFTQTANTTNAERVGTLTVGGLTVTVTQSGASGLQFVPVTPCRIADTRKPAGPFGGPSLPGLGSRDFPVPQSACGIPSTAVAYSLNVTVVPHGLLGYITVWPTDRAKPLASTLNSVDGRVKANAAIVPAGTNGAISIYATEPTDLILDINGYFAPPQGGSLAFYSLPPCRVVDTRSTTALAARETRTVTLHGSCSVPSNAAAVSMNSTVVPKGPLGFLTLWPANVSQPVVSTLNALTGGVTANAAIVPLSPSGQINAYVTEPTDLILDVNGYFAPSSGSDGLQFFPITPCRALDTRNATGSLGGPALAATSVRSAPMLNSNCGLPQSTRGYALNATVVPNGVFGYLTLWATGGSFPLVSTLNAVDGVVASNMAIVPVGTGGSLSMFSSDSGHVLFDIMGYFAP